MIPIGKKCSCGKIHFVKAMQIWDDLNPKEKKRGYKTEHRIFNVGYYRSLERGNEVWEFYLPLTIAKTMIVQEAEKEPEKMSIEEKYIHDWYGYEYT